MKDKIQAILLRQADFIVDNLADVELILEKL
jgi:hypothetical protein